MVISPTIGQSLQNVNNVLCRMMYQQVKNKYLIETTSKRNSPDTKNFTPISSSYWFTLHYTRTILAESRLEDTLWASGDQTVDSDGGQRTGTRAESDTLTPVIPLSSAVSDLSRVSCVTERRVSGAESTIVIVTGSLEAGPKTEAPRTGTNVPQSNSS